MKKTPLMTMAALMVLSQVSLAQEAGHRQLTSEEQQDIAWALNVLAETDSLEIDVNNQIRVNPDIFDEIKQEGLLDTEGSKLSTICVGPWR